MNRTVVRSWKSLVLLAFAGLPVGTLVAQPVAPNFNGPVLHTDSYYQVRSGNVRDWGANGDDLLDDTSAIQAAIDACPGGVYFPPGTYYVSKAAAGNWGIRITRNNMRLSGEGPASIIRITQGGTNFNMVYVEGASTSNPLRNVTIENLTFEGVNGAIGDRASEVNALVRLNRVENATIRGNRFRDYGAPVGGASNREIGESEAIALRDTSRFVISDNIFGAANGGRATCILVDANSRFGTISDNDMSAQSGIGIYGARDTVISNNTIANKLRQGIIIDYVSGGGTATPFNGVISGNTIRNCDAMAIYLLDETPAGAANGTGKMVITGNMIDSCASVNVGNPAGISVQGTRFPVTITGNQLLNTGSESASYSSPAIGLWNNVSVVVSGNSLRSCSTTGIYVGPYDRTSTINISGNTFENVAGVSRNTTIMFEPGTGAASLASTFNVSGNTFIRSTAAASSGPYPNFIRTIGGTIVNIEGNSFAGTGNTDTGIFLGVWAGSDSAVGSIVNNTFTRLRLGIASDQAKVTDSMSFPAANTTKRLLIEGNHFIDSSAGLGLGSPTVAGTLAFVGSNTFSNVPTANWAVSYWPTQQATPVFAPLSFVKFTRNLSPNLVWSDSAAPTTAPNTWRAGDTVHNTNFSAGQPMGWVFNGSAWRTMAAYP